MLDPIDLIQMSSSAKELLAKQKSEHDADEDARTVHGLDLLVVFSGYLDAGNVATQLENILLERLTHQRLATFDTDQLIDYRARRPELRFDGQQFFDYEMPELELHVVTDQVQEPFLLLSGPEPDYQWDRFVASVMLLIDQLDVQLVTFVDAIPLPVPHTRPIGVTTHGTAHELMEGLATWAPKGKMAAGAAQLLELRVAEAGRRVSGYTLHVPHYLADATYPQAAVAGLEYIGAAMGLMLPSEELRESGREVERQITNQLSARSEISTMVQRLEERFDEYSQEHQTRSLLLPPDQRVPDAEELGSAIESYLSDQVQRDDAGLTTRELLGLTHTEDRDFDENTRSAYDPMRPSRSEIEPDAPDTDDEPGSTKEES